MEMALSAYNHDNSLEHRNTSSNTYDNNWWGLLDEVHLATDYDNRSFSSNSLSGPVDDEMVCCVYCWLVQVEESLRVEKLWEE